MISVLREELPRKTGTEQKRTAVICLTTIRNFKLLIIRDQPKIRLSEEIKLSQGAARVCMGIVPWLLVSEPSFHMYHFLAFFNG